MNAAQQAFEHAIEALEYAGHTSAAANLRTALPVHDRVTSLNAAGELGALLASRKAAPLYPDEARAIGREFLFGEPIAPETISLGFALHRVLFYAHVTLSAYGVTDRVACEMQERTEQALVQLKQFRGVP